MTSTESLKKEIDQIKARNKRVETDKAWETSWTRRLLILVLTYIVIVIFFITSKLPNPFANAVVPSLAFLLSTMTVPLIKKWWLNRIHNKTK
jgi:small-conductance mechanosensitive channel